jgi:hypothetical protein
MNGKAFGHRSSKHDNFYTPFSMTEQLLENEDFDYTKSILEPSSGNGAIVKTLRKYFKDISYSDLNLEEKLDNGIHSFGCDFLTDWESRLYDCIITNPPYSLWDEFVKKAKEISKIKFAFLGRLEFLTGISRYENKLYFDEYYPLTRIHIFVRKANLSFTDADKTKIKEHEIYYPKLREDGKYPAGMYHYAWFIFEKASNGEEIFPPIIKMINNQEYILGKNND